LGDFNNFFWLLIAFPFFRLPDGYVHVGPVGAKRQIEAIWNKMPFLAISSEITP
jgi:hypothetical protein